MKKTQVIVMVGVGVFSFAASFGVNWFRHQKAAQAAVAESDPQMPEAAIDGRRQRGVGGSLANAGRLSENIDEQVGLTERELQNLIYDVREKMRQNQQHEKELAKEAERIELARQGLQEDVERLNEIGATLDMKLLRLKEKEDQLQQMIIDIEKAERTNIERLAATYDKMDPSQSGKIMMNMAANNQMADVVKILYYMNERNAARVLGEIGSTQPDVAAALSLQLKRVRQGD
jgi:DNA repair ATPase RecN